MPDQPTSDTADDRALPAGTLEALTQRGWTLRARPGAAGGYVVRDDRGDECTVDTVAVPAVPAARTRLVEHLHALGRGDEHLLRVRAVLETGDGDLAVLTEHVEGLRLDELAAARAPFTAGEAVTVVVPVAQALAALHRTGRVHGALDARAVTVSSAGRAVVRPPLAPQTGTPADDVRDLARLVLGLVPPPASSHPASATSVPAEDADALAALHAELVTAMRDDPRTRPAAGTFAARCYDAAEPRPVAMPDPARLVAAALGGRRDPAGETVPDGSAPPVRTRADARRRERHAPRRRPAQPGRTAARAVVVPLAVLVGCVVLVAVLLALGRPTTPVAGPVAGPGEADLAARAQHPSGAEARTDPTRVRDDPLGAARELTVRHLALVTGRGGDLSAVVVPSSSAEATERALLAELEGVDVLGAQVEVLAVRRAAGPTAASDRATAQVGAEVEVEVDYRIGAHRQRSEAGEVQVPETPRTTVLLALRWTDIGWRVEEVR